MKKSVTIFSAKSPDHEAFFHTASQASHCASCVALAGWSQGPVEVWAYTLTSTLTPRQMMCAALNRQSDRWVESAEKVSTVNLSLPDSVERKREKYTVIAEQNGFKPSWAPQIE